MKINLKELSLMSVLLCLAIIFTACTTQDSGFQSSSEISDNSYVIVDNNTPQFSPDQLTTTAFEQYSELDDLGRCGEAFACIGIELMPTEERGSIGQVKPSGWQMAKYDIVDGKYLYNRCHLIGYQLSGENANRKNLITGTRYFNMEGMLPFEDMVAEYVKETGNHVMYRVTPVFKEDNLLADGVHMEAYSVEDDGEGVCFNVFVPNVQPGIAINYQDGSSRLESEKAESDEKNDSEGDLSKDNKDEGKQEDFVLNTGTKRYHRLTCSSVEDIKDENKESYNGTRKWLEDNGYSPCGNCKP